MTGETPVPLEIGSSRSHSQQQLLRLETIPCLTEETTLTEPTVIDKRSFHKSLLFLLAALAAVMEQGLGRFAFFKIGKSKAREVPKMSRQAPAQHAVACTRCRCLAPETHRTGQFMAFDDRCTHLDAAEVESRPRSF